MTTAEWKAARKAGIGGSDVAAVLGLSPWKSPVDVWMEKTGRVKNDEETPAMYWGTQLEDLVAKEYAKRTGLRVERVNAIMRHPSMPLIGNIDRAVSEPGKKPVVKGEFRTDRILECKTAHAFAANSAEWGEEGTDEIPDYYLTQTLHYLGLTGCQVCDVAVLMGGRDFRMYSVRRNDDLIGRMGEECAKFWRDYVVTDKPPPPRSEADVKALFPRSAEKRVMASTEIEAACLLLAEITGETKKLEGKADGLKDSICAAMGDADTLELPNGKVIANWKSAKDSRKTDWEAVAATLNAPADLIAKHTVNKPGSRRFTLK